MNGGDTSGRIAKDLRTALLGMSTRAMRKATGIATTRAQSVTSPLTRKLWPMVRE